MAFLYLKVIMMTNSYDYLLLIVIVVRFMQ